MRPLGARARVRPGTFTTVVSPLTQPPSRRRVVAMDAAWRGG